MPASQGGFNRSLADAQLTGSAPTAVIEQRDQDRGGRRPRESCTATQNGSGGQGPGRLGNEKNV